MSKKLQRVFRNRHLTQDEVVADKELRQRVQLEYPPKATAAPVQADSLSELLRRSIRESGRSLDEIADASGVSRIVITGFVCGERDIHMTTADRLARTLGLEVTAD
jgi:hypothetical protein